MSTRSSLYYDDNFHLYTDGFDTDNVYLEVSDGGNHWDSVTVITIPLPIWAQMRKHTLEPHESYLGLSYEEMLGIAKTKVAAHREWLETHKDTPLVRFAGVLLYGPPEDTEDTMVANWMQYNYKGGPGAVL